MFVFPAGSRSHHKPEFTSRNRQLGWALLAPDVFVIWLAMDSNLKIHGKTVENPWKTMENS
jgi:hypothetical protein